MLGDGGICGNDVVLLLVDNMDGLVEDEDEADIIICMVGYKLWKIVKRKRKKESEILLKMFSPLLLYAWQGKGVFLSHYRMPILSEREKKASSLKIKLLKCQALLPNAQ